MRPGIKVPLAQIGAELPGGINIGPADKGGVTSYGMLCSSVELDLPDGLALADSDGGIFILPQDLIRHLNFTSLHVFVVGDIIYA